jgi:hypothetical protein
MAAAGNKQILWIEVKADNKDAIKGLKEIEATIKRVPENFSKASAAASALTGALGGVGGKAGAVLGPMSGLLSMLATGGPMALGVAAVTGAVAIGSKAWDTYKESSRQAESGVRSMLAAVEAQSTAARRVGGDLKSLSDDVKYFGLSARQVAVEQLGTQIAMLEGAPDKFEEALVPLRAQLEDMSKLAEDLGWGAKLAGSEADITILRGQIEALEKSKSLAADTLAQARQKLEALNALSALEATAARARAQADAEEKKANDEKLEALRDIKAERKADLEQALASIKAQAEDQEPADLAAKDAAEARAKDIKHLDNLKFESVSVQREMDRIATEERLGLISAEEAERQKMWAREQQRIGQIAQSLGSIWGDVFADMISGQQSAGSAIVAGTIKSAQVAVMAAASSAAAEAAFSQAGIPILGPILAVTAAGMVFAMVSAYMSKIPKAALGGTVVGGTPGRDSVPALLMPGEEILPVGEANRYRAARARGGMGGGLTLNLTVPVQSAITDQTALDRAVSKSIGPALERAFRDGRIRIPRYAVT